MKDEYPFDSKWPNKPECKICKEHSVEKSKSNHPSNPKGVVKETPKHLMVYVRTLSDEIEEFLKNDQFELTTRGGQEDVVLLKIYRTTNEPIYARPGDTIVSYRGKLAVLVGTHLNERKDK